MIGTGPPSTATDNIEAGRLIIEELSRAGVAHFCAAPGSRSTPLTAALAERRDLPQSVITDERGAAFFALGIGRATGQPAALITTSGTAMANALPAAVEADAAGVPLLLLSADRPPELRDTGANQTIDQVKMFGGVTRWYAEVPCPGSGLPPQALLTTLDQAVHRTRCQPPGPVHLNLMFREPLSGSGPDLGDPPVRDPRLEQWLRSGDPWTRTRLPVLTPATGDRDELLEILSSARRGLVVIGAIHDADERASAQALATALGWPVWADLTSGLTGTVPMLDALLGSPEIRRKIAPDVLLHLGGPVLSKRHLAWLAELPPTHHVVIRPDPGRLDPAHCVTLQLTAHLAAVGALPRVGAGNPALIAAAQAAQAAVGPMLPDGSEPDIARRIAAAGLPVFAGNSMPIRDLDLFADPRPPNLAANRGASGIDGLLACAAGWTAGLGEPSAALIGDLSTLHDLSSLAILARSTPSVAAVVINNGGGGIFSFLPIAGLKNGFDSHFATTHSWQLAPVAAAFGLSVVEARDGAALSAALSDFRALPRPTLIEVTTDRVDNADLHRQLHRAAIAAALRHL
ncbi:MAG: 2-succinyl-5-enolpyruvyl-6-hydroxy-3-cyclohexene-1-carboxylic-acid synthase [Myxococcota bacterium]|nr:2-succinyl-5-enolpyruvyl-6-hydroxy-3-cyclohexene-1-carboxylic-acid synthase [Myxococcota bacterium]